MHNKKLKKKGGGQILSTRLPHIVVASPNIRPYLEPLFFFSSYFVLFILSACFGALLAHAREGKKKETSHPYRNKEGEREEIKRTPTTPSKIKATMVVMVVAAVGATSTMRKAAVR